MSVRSEAERAATTTATSIPTAGAVAQDVQATIIAAQTADNQLDAANDLAVHSPEHPLNRFIAVSVRASLEDLCLRKNRAVWKPTAEAAAAIMKQPKFTDLSGKTEAQGDLNSVVLHKMEIQNVKSTFPVAIGANFTGVDANTFSVTGQSFGHIVLAGEASSTPRTLQEDDVSLCYEFSKKFPGYTSQNLGDKGVHEVHARKFVLVSADHPMVSAISENADKLQMGEISMMPEGLVKVSQGLFDAIMPMVKKQVESQIKVRSFADFEVSIAPAEYSSWSEARTDLLQEAKAALKARMQSECASVPDGTTEEEVAQMRANFAREERKIEHDIDSQVFNFSALMSLTYNFLSK